MAKRSNIIQHQLDPEASPKIYGSSTDPRTDAKKTFSLAKELADDSICERNWKFDGADESFPHQPALRSVEMYFPYAKGGPLLIDHPKFKSDEDDCKEKAKVLREKGYRYVIFKAGMTLQDAYEQMGAS